MRCRAAPGLDLFDKRALQRRLFMGLLHMYIGVSCPVRSLNMAAGIVFMWI